MWAAFKLLPLVARLKIIVLAGVAVGMIVSAAYLAGRLIENSKCKTRAQGAAIEKGIEKNEIRNHRPDASALFASMRSGRL